MAAGVVYEFGNGTTCFLYTTPNAGTSQASQAFREVDDIERELADLKARGVTSEKYNMPEMDENGICGEQRLVITGDLIRLLAHRPKVFPGAKIRSEQPLDRGQHIDRLVAVLLSSDQLDEISTSVVGDKLGVEWGHISGNLKKHKSYDAVLESIGWSYHRGSGSRAGCFRRIGRTNPLGSDDSDSN